VKIIGDDEYTLKFEDVLKKDTKKVDEILLEEMKGAMVDNMKLKKLSGVHVAGENKESLFAKNLNKRCK
jgi:hypothetical protein